jgi:hypothetical protein
MIIKYDLNKFFKEKGLNKAHFARKVGMSKQLFAYHVKKGDLPISVITIIAEELDTPVDRLVQTLNKNYVKTKI